MSDTLVNFCTLQDGDGDCAGHCTILTLPASHTEVHNTGNEDQLPASDGSQVLHSGL